MASKKPKGRKYRNLHVRADGIYYNRVWRGRRYCFSTKTRDWDTAASTRDLYEERKGIGNPALSALRIAEAPTLAEFAPRYLAEDTAHLAATTLRERAYALAEDGLLLAELGKLPLAEMREVDLRHWWGAVIEQPRVEEGKVRHRAPKTGRNYLDALSAVFQYARELGLVEQNPVDGFRRVLARKRRTQRGRAAAEERDIRPIEDPADLEALLEALRAGPDLPRGKRGRKFDPVAAREVFVYGLLMLDAGLRSGEAFGLRWRCVEFDPPDERHPALRIEESRPRGGEPGPTKSGRSRRVALSMRLLVALGEFYRERRPDPESHVLSASPKALRLAWDRSISRAKLTVRPKDLRDTYASQLLTCGIQIGYISKQLGHADIGVTVRHYAKWCGGDEYRKPVPLAEGETPADLLARLGKSQGTRKVKRASSGGDDRARI